jgi:hypothetical protein
LAIIKEEVISILREIPDEATLVEIERAIITKTLPSALPHSKKVEKQIIKFEKLNRELNKLIKKFELNPKYLQETIPIQNVRNSFHIERDFYIR